MAIISHNNNIDEIPNLVFLELSRAASKKKHPFKNVVLTTINEKNPKSRWVVFRKLTHNKNLLIYTDFRSKKIQELRKNLKCGLLFYQNKQGLQVHFNASCTIHHNNEFTKKYWQFIAGSSSENYTTVYPPSTAINTICDGHRIDKNLNDRYFSIIEFYPSEMSVLQLSREGHIRANFIKVDNNWKGFFIVP